MLQNTLSEVAHCLAITCKVIYQSLNCEADRRYLFTTVFQVQMEQQGGLGWIFNSKLQKVPCFISLGHRLLAECGTCGVAAGLAVLSHERSCLSALALRCQRPSAGAAPPEPRRKSCARAGAGSSSCWVTNISCVTWMGFQGLGDSSVGEAGTHSAREMCFPVNWE